MICLRCDNETFKEEERDVEQELRGLTFYVKTDVMVCTKCGWFTCTLEQAGMLREKAKKTFDLLSSGAYQ